MAGKNSPQYVIDSYKKRQQSMPFILGGLAIVLVVVGIIVLVVWLTGSDRPALSFLSTETATPTETSTATPVTPTLTLTQTPTETITPTITQTSTPSGPFEYTVQDDDVCWDLAIEFEVDLQVLQGINNFGNDCPITPGQVILIPAPGQALPTETSLPTGLAPGTKIEYTVKSNDTLDIIANKLNTTIDAIMEDNDLEDVNTIFVGQVLTIRINIVTPTVTMAPTSTSAATATP